MWVSLLSPINRISIVPPNWTLQLYYHLLQFWMPSYAYVMTKNIWLRTAELPVRGSGSPAMSRPIPGGPPSKRNIRGHRRSHSTGLSFESLPPGNSNSQRASVSGISKGIPKAQRTSKTSQKLVVLPSAPQTEPLLLNSLQDLTHGHETDAGIKEYKSEAEKMTKQQRKEVSSVRSPCLWKYQ